MPLTLTVKCKCGHEQKLKKRSIARHVLLHKRSFESRCTKCGRHLTIKITREMRKSLKHLISRAKRAKVKDKELERWNAEWLHFLKRFEQGEYKPRIIEIPKTTKYVEKKPCGLFGLRMRIVGEQTIKTYDAKKIDGRKPKGRIETYFFSKIRPDWTFDRESVVRDYLDGHIKWKPPFFHDVIETVLDKRDEKEVEQMLAQYGLKEATHDPYSSFFLRLTMLAYIKTIRRLGVKSLTIPKPS